MVGWFDPPQLARTGVDVAISTIFGRAADFRMLEALAAPQEDFDCTTCESDEPAWVDYVGDTGDGWNSTYGVAYWLTRPALKVETRSGKGDEEVAARTRMAQILIFGGDQVYPTASRGEYETRLVQPYKAAYDVPNQDNPPQLYAIPGNHDWYDNLVSFTRLFCSKEWFAGWRTRQKRSYFALRLPYGWWLIGTDVQLGSDIDEAQLSYFRQAAAKMGPDDRVILCTAEPHWIFAESYRETDPQYYSEKTLSFLESKVFPGRIQVFLAGDLHHYRRHESEDGRQKITSGGGGAFLHPTHGGDFNELHQDLSIEKDGAVTAQHTVYKKRESYPSESTSFLLGFRNLLFPFLNPTFGLFTAVLYLLCAWTTLPKLRSIPVSDLTFPVALRAILLDPLATVFLLLIILGFVFFTDTHFKIYKWLAGIAHAMLHISAALFVGRFAVALAAELWQQGSLAHLLTTAVLIFAGGWIVGSFVFGFYLLISINVFGRHWNEGFSSLKIQDYKNFIRMRIDPDGSLTIFPIGIEKVARRWRKPPDGQWPKYEPVEPFTEPFLIEKPIRIPAP